jgi:sulfonate transport system ATP-binding protein
MSTPAITTTGLAKSFSTPEGTPHRVLEGIDLTVEPGEFVCLLGPTGCGKTTLLRVITGLEEATAGEVRVGDDGVPGRAASVGMVFQQNSLLPWRRIDRNVAFPLEMAGMPRSQARARAREYLKLVRLENVERAFPYELSGGMQQRAAIARALATGSNILLLDEPFGALDDQTRIVLQEVLLDIWAERKATVLFVTHNIEESLVLGDRILVLGGGRILSDERVDLARPRDRFSTEFVDALVRLRRTFASAVSGDAGVGTPLEGPSTLC